MKRWDFESLSGGVNLADRPDALLTGQASAVGNVWFREGALRPRPGKAAAEDWGLDAPVDALCDDQRGSFYIQSGGKLWRRHGGVTEALWTLSPSGDGTVTVGSFVPHSNACVYFVNGTEFLLIDGSSVSAAAPYYPVHLYTQERVGSGGAQVVESPNLLTNWIRVRYHLVDQGTTAIFDLPKECLSNVKPIEVLCNGSPQTVSSISGRRVTLSKSISMSNVVLEVTAQIKATVSDIRSCRSAVMFGPESRMILFGNGSNHYFVSGAFNPTYFPADGEHAFGSGDPITGAGKLYDLLVLFKARELAEVRPSDGYLASTVNPVIGCDMPGSICTVGNRLVWANSYSGVHMLVSTSRANERNVRNISRNVDPALLAEDTAELQAASSCDWDGHYLLCVGDRVYVWDYRERPYTGADENAAARALAWYVWEGLSAQFWMSSGAELCYLRRSSAELIRLAEGRDDMGQPFAVRWKSGAVCPAEPGYCFHADEACVTVPRDRECVLTLVASCDEREENAPHACGTITVPASPTGYSAARVFPLRLRDARSVSLDFSGTNAGFGLQKLGIYWRKGGRERR